MSTETDDQFWDRLLDGNDPAAPGTDWVAAAFGARVECLCYHEESDHNAEDNGLTGTCALCGCVEFQEYKP